MIDLIDTLNTESGHTFIMALMAALVLAMLAKLVQGWQADRQAARRHTARMRVLRLRHDVAMRRLKDRYGTHQTERF